jgi:DNA oxidative demethylase
MKQAKSDLFGHRTEDPSATAPVPRTFRHLPGALSAAEQVALLADIEACLQIAPRFTPTMPRTGKPFSVAMSNAGPLGWVSDRSLGYRYQGTHPETGCPWPAIPAALLSLWTTHANYPAPPEACLINFYVAGAKMGSHVDRDEQDRNAPVLSVSLGDDAVFHVGGAERGGRKDRVTLKSGDVLLLEGPSRFAYHGIDRVLPGTSSLIPGGGRINLTLRRVTVG